MKNKLLILMFVLMFAFYGCQSESLDETVNTTAAVESSIVLNAESVTSPNSDMFSDKDIEVGYDESESCRIILSGNSAACDSASVKIEDDGHITITEEGTYIISGTLDNGMLIVDAGDNAKPKLVLENVNITNKKSSAIFILSADKVFVTLAEGSENKLSCVELAESVDGTNLDGVVFSKQDLTFNGNGNLEIVSPSGHGIVCKDDLVFTSGSFRIGSASHGVDVNDSFRCASATLDVTAGKDGIHVENTEDTEKGFVYFQSGLCTISSEGDGISASNYIEILSGEINITAGGGYVNGSVAASESYGGFMGDRPPEFNENQYDTSEESVSMKGMKSSEYINIFGSKINIDSADDALHSDKTLEINGGEINILSGDDAVHAEETLTINDGVVSINESYEGLEALEVVINDGEIKLKSSDDGINAAGGNDESGYEGRDNGNFGGRGGMGGPGGFVRGGSSNGSIAINGGNLYVMSWGDGIDANGSLEITGGYTVVCGPTQGDTAVLDYDVAAKITGGTFIGTGSSMMAQAFTDNENQGVMALGIGYQPENTEISIQDMTGKEILNYSPELSYEILIFSSQDIVTGETYNVIVGENTGEITAY